VLEEETDPRRFSIHRLGRYCLHLSELIGTRRVVPVVIFLRPGHVPRELILCGDRHTHMDFRYLPCHLRAIPFERYRDSDNIVARLNLPNMHYAPDRRVEVYAQALRGLMTLEPDPERRLKYLDFIDIYTGLDDNEVARFRRDYPDEVEAMTRFAERFREEGRQEMSQFAERFREEGRQEGMYLGEARMLLRQLQVRFGDVPDAVRQRIEAADEATLLAWSERVLSARASRT
jgi:hypothetical protein